MKLVVDTNRIIAALIKDSVSRRIINHINAELLTISFLDKEIQKHKEVLLKKSGLSEVGFNVLFDKIMEKILVLDDKIIETKIKEASKIMDNIDPDDTPFIAAALATDTDIWSDDKHFERQHKVKIWKTKDLEKFV